MFRLSNLIKSTLENEKSRSLDGSIIIWNMTNRCNLLCHHCYSKASANEKETLALEDILNTIPKLKKAGVNFVIFSGGEPLLRKDIFEIAKQLPNTSKMISDLQNLKETIDSILEYVKQVDYENRKLKSEMIDLYKRLKT